MTPAELVKALPAAIVSLRLTPVVQGNGLIRAVDKRKPPNRWGWRPNYCPLTCVATHLKNPDGTLQHNHFRYAARLLGVSRDDMMEIVKAADNRKGCDPQLRSALMRANGKAALAIKGAA